MVNRKEISFFLLEYDEVSELPLKEQHLLNKATEAALDAWAPYSEFKVGAAIVLGNGQIVIGNNQENAAYPSGLCAERVAVFSACAQFPQEKIKAIAVTAYSAKLKVSFPVPPCGACRQVLSECEGRFQSPIKLILRGEVGKILTVDSVASLLPLTFSNSSMGK